MRRNRLTPRKDAYRHLVLRRKTRSCQFVACKPIGKSWAWLNQTAHVPSVGFPASPVWEQQISPDTSWTWPERPEKPARQPSGFWTLDSWEIWNKACWKWAPFPIHRSEVQRETNVRCTHQHKHTEGTGTSAAGHVIRAGARCPGCLPYNRAELHHRIVGTRG